MLEQYLARAIIRHLDGDKERFNRYAERAHELYKREKHLYVSIQEIIEAKGA
jgi:hypothetical protein